MTDHMGRGPDVAGQDRSRFRELGIGSRTGQRHDVSLFLARNYPVVFSVCLASRSYSAAIFR